MSRCTKRSSKSAMDAFKRRVAMGDLYEATAPRAKFDGVCECSRPMRKRVGRCGTCAAAELKTLGVDPLGSAFRVREKCVERVWR